MTNIKLNLDNAAISQEELMNLLKEKGIAVEATKPKTIDKLEYDEDGLAHCKYCHELVDLDELTEEETSQIKKTGLCPECLAKLDELKNMKAMLKGTRTVVNGGSNVGKDTRSWIEEAIPNMTEEQIEEFTTKEFAKSLGISFALLKEVTDMTDEEIKTARKDAKGYYRYGSKIYSAYDRQFVLTKELYARHKDKIHNYLVKENLIAD